MGALYVTVEHSWAGNPARQWHCW